MNINKKIVNKGTGAGGSNTNKNGLRYEDLTDLKTEFNIIKSSKYYELIQFNNINRKYVRLIKSQLFKYMKMNKEMNEDIPKAHGCKQPDECYIDEDSKIIYIIEKKFQQTGGSVCEKIQTGYFKKTHYNNIFPNYTVNYIYTLSDWFNKNCKSEIVHLKEINIPVFWGSDKEYKNKIINYITNNYQY